MENSANKFSRFHSHSTSSSTGISLKDFIDEVRSDQHKENCDRLRTEITKDESKQIKDKLAGVTFSTLCKGGRRIAEASNHTELFQVDLDLQDDHTLSARKGEIKDKLRTLPSVAAFFDSPSGGLKIVVAVDCVDVAGHKRAWNVANEFISSELDVKTDSAVSSIVSLCYVSYDPEAFMNDQLFPLDLPAEEVEVMPEVRPAYEEPPLDAKLLIAESALAAIPERPDHNVWVKLIAAVADYVGEASAEGLLKARFPEETAGEYTEKMSNRLDGVHAATLFYLAQEHGWRSPPGITSLTKEQREKAYRSLHPKEATAHVEFFSEGILKAVFDDIHDRSNPRNVELTSGATIGVLSAMLGQQYKMLNGSYDNRANTQIVMLAPSGAGKDAPFRYHEKAVSAIYGNQCYVSTYASPTVVQSRLKRTGYCFDGRDEAGDLLKSIKGSDNSATGQIGAMIKTLATSATTSYNGFTESSLKENPVSFYCPNPFYCGLSVATPRQFLEATNDGDIEGGYWGRVLFFSVSKVARRVRPSEIEPQSKDFSPAVWKMVEHFKKKMKSQRDLWEANAEEYSVEANPQNISLTPEASDYLFDVAEDYLAKEKLRDDYDRIAPVAQRLGELAAKLFLIHTVSRCYGTDMPLVADLASAKVCWSYALELHEEKLRQLGIQAESAEEKIVRYAVKACERTGTLTRATLRKQVSRTKNISKSGGVEALVDSGLFQCLPSNAAPTSFKLI